MHSWDGDLSWEITKKNISDRVTHAVFGSGENALTGQEKRNAWTHVAAGAGTKLGEKLSSPEMVLPWFLGALGAPIALVGLLVPIRQAGSLLPQLFLIGLVKRLRHRKWVWALATAGQGGAIGLMAMATLMPNPRWAGGWLILFFIGFSLARGLASLSYKDALARTVPTGSRGSIMGVRGAVAGGAGLLAGGILQLNLGNAEAAASFPPLLGMAGGLMMAAAVLFVTLSERLPAEEESSTESWRDQVAAGWQRLRGADFRRFILVRGLFLAVPLAYPFFALEGRTQLGAEIGGLGLMLITLSLAEIISSPFWGRLANRSSHHVMAWGGGLFLASIAGVGTARLASGWLAPVLFLTAFFVLGLSYAGVRLGRKAYLVEAVPDDQRAAYVATANSAIGVLTLTGFGLAVVTQVSHLDGALIALAICGLGATVLAFRLPSPRDFRLGNRQR